MSYDRILFIFLVHWWFVTSSLNNLHWSVQIIELIIMHLFRLKKHKKQQEKTSFTFIKIHISNGFVTYNMCISKFIHNLFVNIFFYFL